MTFRFINAGQPLLSLQRPAIYSIGNLNVQLTCAGVSLENATLIGYFGKRRVPLITDEDVESLFREIEFPAVEIIYGRAPQELTEELAQREKDHVAHLEDENVRLAKEWNEMKNFVKELEEARAAEQEKFDRALEAQSRRLEKFVQDAADIFHEKSTVLDQNHEEFKTLAADSSAICTQMKEDFEAQAAQCNEKIEKFEVDVITVAETAAADVKNMQEKFLETDELVNKNDHVQTQQAEVLREFREIVCYKENLAEARQELCDQIEAVHNELDNKIDQLNAKVEILDSAQSKVAAANKEEVFNRILAGEEAEVIENQKLRQACIEDTNRVSDDQKVLRDQVEIRIDQIKSAAQNQLLEMRTEMAQMAAEANRLNKASTETVQGMMVSVAETERVLRAETQVIKDQLAEGLEVIDHKSEEIRSDLKKFSDRIDEMEKDTRIGLAKMTTDVANARDFADAGVQSTKTVCQTLTEGVDTLRHNVSKNMSRVIDDFSACEIHLCKLEKVKNRILEDFNKFSIMYQGHREKQRGKNESTISKILGIYRQLEPRIIEWKIDRVQERTAECQQPRCIRSPPGIIRGCELQMDWFPNGNGQSIYAPGVCLLRLYAAPHTKIKFEVTIGNYTDGTRDWDTDIKDIWFDIHLPEWERQIARDTLTIKIEIVKNFHYDDQDIGDTAVRLFNSLEENEILEEERRKQEERIQAQKDALEPKDNSTVISKQLSNVGELSVQGSIGAENGKTRSNAPSQGGNSKMPSARQDHNDKTPSHGGNSKMPSARQDHNDKTPSNAGSQITENRTPSKTNDHAGEITSSTPKENPVKESRVISKTVSYAGDIVTQSPTENQAKISRNPSKTGSQVAGSRTPSQSGHQMTESQPVGSRAPSYAGSNIQGSKAPSLAFSQGLEQVKQEALSKELSQELDQRSAQSDMRNKMETEESGMYGDDFENDSEA